MLSVGVFIHWLAEDDKIQEYNYQATKESIERAVSGEPKANDVVSQKDSAEHPFGLLVRLIQHEAIKEY